MHQTPCKKREIKLSAKMSCGCPASYLTPKLFNITVFLKRASFSSFFSFAECPGIRHSSFDILKLLLRAIFRLIHRCCQSQACINPDFKVSTSGQRVDECRINRSCPWIRLCALYDTNRKSGILQHVAGCVASVPSRLQTSSVSLYDKRLGRLSLTLSDPVSIFFVNPVIALFTSCIFRPNSKYSFGVIRKRLPIARTALDRS